MPLAAGFTHPPAPMVRRPAAARKRQHGLPPPTIAWAPLPRCGPPVWPCGDIFVDTVMVSPYDIGLDRNPANFQPLTPLQFLERAASVFPDHPAVIHGGASRPYGELYARARRLASALAAKGIGRGDTVS